MSSFFSGNYDFLRWRWHAIVFSVLVVVVGVAQLARTGIPLGIDFSGGTLIVLKFQQATTEEAVRNAVAELPGEAVVQLYGDPGDHEIMVRLAQSLDVEEGVALEQDARRVQEAVEAAGLGEFEVTKTELVGPAVGRDLQRKGLFATITSLLGIAAYIALRFRPSFALGAIAASVHDIVISLIVVCAVGYELSLNIIAAILTIAGYSSNDTIVIFDRVRENARTMKSLSLSEQVNRAVNQTLSRTVITAGTTFLAVFGLYLYGGDALEGFAFTMLVGVAAGTYSTVFIASSLAIALSKGTVQASAAPSRAVDPETRARRRERRNA
jgi:preprotein translocase subunit SecF